MSEHKQYWADPVHCTTVRGVFLELRCELAWDLIHHFGSIAAKTQGEDSAGRHKIELQTPKEIVERVFAIVDIFVDKAELRGELREDSVSQEDKALAVGRLERIKTKTARSKDEIDQKLAKQK